VTVAKCTVVVIAPWRRDAAGSGRLGAAIRRVNAGVLAAVRIRA
jgi:hypothetical protein